MHTNLFFVIIFIDRTATSTRLLTKETKRQLVEDSDASMREKSHAFWIYSRSRKSWVKTSTRYGRGDL